jgi:hypothetical protein
VQKTDGRMCETTDKCTDSCGFVSCFDVLPPHYNKHAAKAEQEILCIKVLVWNLPEEHLR